MRLALTAKVAVLTGGPGCGKTFTVRSVVTLARGEAGQGRAGRADRAGRQAAGRADRARGGHRAPAAGAAPGGDAAYDRDHPLDADLVVVDEASHAGPAAGQQAGQGGRRRARTCCWSATSTSCPRSAPGEVLRDLLAAGRHPAGAADPDLPAGPAVRRGDQRAPDQRRPAARSSAGIADFFLFAEDEPEATARADRGRRGPAHPAPGSASTRAATSRCCARCTAARPAPGTSTRCCRRRSPRAAPGMPERRLRRRGSSGSATRSPRSATTTTRARPGSSTAPSASSPPCRWTTSS